jgi:hypothetical protein
MPVPSHRGSWEFFRITSPTAKPVTARQVRLAPVLVHVEPQLLHGLSRDPAGARLVAGQRRPVHHDDVQAA